ncbi:MAG: FAD-dependent oxidoreductase [Hyphomicrobiales bacterium]
MNSTPRAFNWEESIDLLPAIVAKPRNVEEIIRIINDQETYPSPIRASGSRHSTTKCTVTDGGTLMDMRNMNRIIEIKENLVTVEAGCLFVDVAQELKRYNLQFYVNVEIGNISMGSAATCGTKDASFAGEYGQMASYVESLKMVNGKGEVIEITKDEKELMQVVRSSYGLMGVVYEITFRVKSIKPLKVWHKSYSLEEFVLAHPDLCNARESLMFYLFPFSNKIVIEFREYSNKSFVFGRNSHVWRLRNFVWKKLAPGWGYVMTRFVPFIKLRYKLIDCLNKVIAFLLVKLIRSSKTVAADQIIRYPEKKNISKYTFSIWAFPQEDYPETLRAYFRFCKDFYNETGYRTNVLNVGYKIDFDQSPLFSYSYNGSVMTADPVDTGDKLWDEFLIAYNKFCDEHNGIPMFNQSKHLTRDQVWKALGDRINTFWKYREKFDPNERLLNNYFRHLFKPDSNEKKESTEEK